MDRTQSISPWTDEILTQIDHSFLTKRIGDVDVILSNNPNKETGAEFYCENEFNWDNLTQKVETSNKCCLFCDKESMQLRF